MILPTLSFLPSAVLSAATSGISPCAGFFNACTWLMVISGTGQETPQMMRLLGWALLMLFTGLATMWLRGVVDPLLPADDWHGMLSGLSSP